MLEIKNYLKALIFASSTAEISLSLMEITRIDFFIRLKLVFRSTSGLMIEMIKELLFSTCTVVNPMMLVLMIFRDLENNIQASRLRVNYNDERQAQ